MSEVHDIGTSSKVPDEPYEESSTVILGREPSVECTVQLERKTLSELMDSPNPVSSKSDTGSPDIKDNIDVREYTNKESETNSGESTVSSRELKSLLALSKEANLDTNIPHKTRKTFEYKKRDGDSPVTPSNTKYLIKKVKSSNDVRNIRFPVTAESELEVESADLHKSEENSNNKSIKRKKPSLTEVSTGGATEDDIKKSRKSLTQQLVMFKANKDIFCWRCHRDGVNIACETCPRSYHQKCLKQTINDPDHWPCPECVGILKAESTQTRSEAMRGMTLEHLCSLLKYAVNRMIGCQGSEPFVNPVNDKEFPDYKKYIIQPMDLTLLGKNIKENLYGSTQAFEADAKWMLHNSIIFNSYQSKLTSVAKTIVKICKQEMAEIENCPSCYLNANTKKKTWFVEVCPKPHLLVWAKLKGFPYWPGKVMTCKGGMVDVRFFGAHDRAWVSERDCYLFSEKDPNTFKQKRYDIEQCVEELNLYVGNLRKAFGDFQYAPYKTLIDPENEGKQLQIFLPKYKSPSNTNEVSNKRYSSDGDYEKWSKEDHKSLKELQRASILENTDVDPDKQKKQRTDDSRFNRDESSIMDGYGTDDESVLGINTQRRKVLLTANDNEVIENEEDDDEDEDDTQVPSNIGLTPGKVRLTPRQSVDTETPLKRPMLEETSHSPQKLSRRNSEASVRSDSSRISNISDKISRVDISENMEITLGNDDAGCMSISENISSNNSETSRSDSDNNSEIKKKPVQVDIENAEFTISPSSKLKIADKLMKRLSDADENAPGSVDQRIEDVKKKLSPSPEKKSQTDILIEKFKDVVPHKVIDFSMPSTSSPSNKHEDNVSTSYNIPVDKGEVESAETVDKEDIEDDDCSSVSDEENENEISSSKEASSSIKRVALTQKNNKNVEYCSKNKNSSGELVVAGSSKSKEIEELEEITILTEPNKKKTDSLISDKNSISIIKINDKHLNRISRKKFGDSNKKEKGEHMKDTIPKSLEDCRDVLFKKNDESEQPVKKKFIIMKLTTNDREGTIKGSPRFLSAESRKKLAEKGFKMVTCPSKKSTLKTYENDMSPKKTILKVVSKNDFEENNSISKKITKTTEKTIENDLALVKVSTTEVESDGDDKQQNLAEIKDITKKDKIHEDANQQTSNDKINTTMNIIEEIEDDEMEGFDDSHIDKDNIINIIHSSLNSTSKNDITESKKPQLNRSKSTDRESLKKTDQDNEPHPANKKTYTNKKRRHSEEDNVNIQTKVLKLVSVEEILNGGTNDPKDSTRSSLEAKTNKDDSSSSSFTGSNSILLKSLQAKKVTRKFSNETSSNSSLSTHSSVQEMCVDDIKQEVDSDVEFHEPENLEEKKKYLSALNISEKRNEPQKPKSNEIRTRSKTEEKREKFKVVDNLTRVIDDVAVNYSAEHDGEALPHTKKSDIPNEKQEGEIYVKSFAKIMSKHKPPRKSNSLTEHTKCANKLKEAPTLSANPLSAPKLPTVITVSHPQNSQASTVLSQAQNSVGLQLHPVEPMRTNGYIILQQAPPRELLILPPNQPISYANTGVTNGSTVDSTASVSVTPTVTNTTENPSQLPSSADAKKTNLLNLESSQNYIPQNEEISPVNPPDLVPNNNQEQLSSLTSFSNTPEQQTSPNGATPQNGVAAESESDPPDEFSLLNSVIPENVSQAVSDLLRRPPPKLKPRPPGMLSKLFDEGIPSTAGNVTARINSVAHRLGDYFRGMLTETLEDLGKAKNPEATITNLKLEIESLKHRHRVELSEIEKNVCTVLKDIQRSLVEDRERIIDETRAACEAEAIKRIEDAKSKQWCANCSREAQFYCCWNTSYCDYPCQQKHWPQHMGKCTQNLNQPIPLPTASAIRPGGQPLILRPANPPPKGGMGRILTKPVQKVYMNRTLGASKTMKVQTTSGTQLTMLETSPGNYQLLGNPITVRPGPVLTSVRSPSTSNVISVSTPSTSNTIISNINKKSSSQTQPKAPVVTRMISHTLPVTTVLREDSE